MNADLESKRMTRLKNDIRKLCESYMAENPIGVRARGIMMALLYNAAVFKGMFDAQSIEIVDAELFRICERTEAESRRYAMQQLNIIGETENGSR